MLEACRIPSRRVKSVKSICREPSWRARLCFAKKQRTVHWITWRESLQVAQRRRKLLWPCPCDSPSWPKWTRGPKPFLVGDLIPRHVAAGARAQPLGAEPRSQPSMHSTSHQPKAIPRWVWLKIKQEGQTAGFGPCFHFPGQPILEFRFFEPQPGVLASNVQDHIAG